MAEFGSRGGGTSSGGIASSPSPAHGKVAFKAGDGEGGGGGGGGGGVARTHLDSAGNGVSNGDCALMGTREETESTQSDSPATERGCPTLQPDGKPGHPKKTSIIKDGTKQKRERKKTVSFSSMPTEKKISSASDCINAMVEGSELRKVRSNSRIYHRYFLLDADMQSLRWEPSKKDSEKAKIDVKSIKEVRTGKNTDIFRSNGISEQISEDCAFSIIYGDNYESLDLVANSADVANIWVTGLRYLISYGKHTLDMLESSQDKMRTSWVSQMFKETDIDNLGRISMCRAVQFIKNLNPGLKSSKIELKFKELHRTKDKPGTEITKEEFIEVFHELCTRPEIYFLLVQFSSNKEFLDTKDLMMFLEAEQGIAHVTEEISLDIIHKYEPSKEGQEKGWLSIDGFTNYLTSPECHIFDPEHKKVCQGMNHPLSHYFINSSHNTYLIEDQFRGPSDITGYIRALKMGCRCVELDVWDGPDNEPVIYTGHTMTSQIVFRSVIDIINKYAFVASEYPLILCLENHCCLKQQKVMVQHIKKILGDKVHTQSPNTEESYLPSPESLRGKILIKAKKLSPNCSGLEGDVTDEDEGVEMSQRMGKEGVEQQNIITVKRFQLCKELSELVSMCKSVQFKDFQVSFQLQKYWEVCSFNEVLATKYANENPGDFVNYNKRFLARVFPSPMRIDSSNMNPQDFWKCGCQIVAMNFQTPGLMMDLNIGWFRQNGNCGYVLRPAIMREEVSYFSANTKDSVPGVSPQLLHVKIISGQNFPKPKGSGAKGDVVDPYVYVEIHGIPADCAEQRTKTVHQNGDNPIFDESFEFQINLPELAMVRFVVLDDDYIGDEFIGQYTIPFECLQTGYRHVPLQSLTGEALAHAFLFVHVAITNRRGGGKPHKRGLSVRKSKKSREYACMRTLWIKTIDEVFKNALQPIRDATDLRENMQNAVVLFKELCGLSPVANLMQCILAVSTRLVRSDNTPLVVMNLSEQYPVMELQGIIPEVLKKIVTAYETMIQTIKTLIENADNVYEKIAQCQKAAMEFHENLQSIGAREGLKERKLQKAVESFTWNITILKGQADLLKDAKNKALENLKQIHYATVSCGLNKPGSETAEGSKPRRSLEAIPEKAGEENGE
ncbi:inactive phospholipase C-like protein 2 isoform X1 [Podarcis raffonei]|uniref:inactive phospholipase C-like protein 2 isoform X1 n=1 Tax=Podarcis raffonei TaxID=65483 RepID=UPI002329866E|nr:inactive phospholipase C-like protein 2 isoform X1 [Podarcis raffonei]XP_053215239.1 inactive phospholipase C-like protein 2 isoform X1 [Podarcis raffonei]XP_053215240.1 inactive phospholipase C-like protein 2 isoform X1 [Podarcis raffonei]XP_053215241.1 inactive phospholipase C-like protein 2 isoform X1 [Podarcis raffonei]